VGKLTVKADELKTHHLIDDKSEADAAISQ